MNFGTKEFVYWVFNISSGAFLRNYFSNIKCFCYEYEGNSRRIWKINIMGSCDWITARNFITHVRQLFCYIYVILVTFTRHFSDRHWRHITESYSKTYVAGDHVEFVERNKRWSERMHDLSRLILMKIDVWPSRSMIARWGYCSWNTFILWWKALYAWHVSCHHFLSHSLLFWPRSHRSPKPHI